MWSPCGWLPSKIGAKLPMLQVMRTGVDTTTVVPTPVVSQDPQGAQRRTSTPLRHGTATQMAPSTATSMGAIPGSTAGAMLAARRRRCPPCRGLFSSGASPARWSTGLGAMLAARRRRCGVFSSGASPAHWSRGPGWDPSVVLRWCRRWDPPGWARVLLLCWGRPVTRCRSRQNRTVPSMRLCSPRQLCLPMGAGWCHETR